MSSNTIFYRFFLVLASQNDPKIDVFSAFFDHQSLAVHMFSKHSIRSDIFESRIHSTFCPICLKYFFGCYHACVVARPAVVTNQKASFTSLNF